MRLNPEFQRNLWLELTPHRLIGMPGVLGIIFLMVYLGNENIYSKAIVNTAVFLYFMLVVVWGCRLSSEAITSEIRDKTWDSQRMTAISPWSMSWAKLFSSTIFTWYGGLICALVYLVSASGTTTSGDNLKNLLLLLLTGMLAQSIALLVGITQSVGRRQGSKYASSPGMLLGIFAALPLMRIKTGSADTIEWYGNIYSEYSFALFTLLFFTSWAIIGIYRLMRSELQVANTPLVWILFLFILPAYAAGFIENQEDRMDNYLLLIYFSTIIITYLSLFSEKKDPITFKRLIFQMKHGGGIKTLYHVPTWLSSLFLLILITIVITVTDISIRNLNLNSLIGTSFFAGMLFVIRDISIFLFFNFSDRPRRADTVSIVYLFLLYGIVPAIFSSIGLAKISAAFTPWNTHEGITIISAALQAGFMAFLAIRRWRALSPDKLPSRP